MFFKAYNTIKMKGAAYTGRSVQCAIYRGSTQNNSQRFSTCVRIASGFESSRGFISHNYSDEYLDKNNRSHICRAEALDNVTENAANDFSVPTSNVWQLDFCSRPILDERGKKVWEVLICDPERNFEFAQFFPNNKINSTEVRCTYPLITTGHLTRTHHHNCNHIPPRCS